MRISDKFVRVLNKEDYKPEPIDLCQNDFPARSLAKIAAKIDRWFVSNKFSKISFDNIFTEFSKARKYLDEAEKYCQSLSKFSSKYRDNYKADLILNNYMESARTNTSNGYGSLSTIYRSIPETMRIIAAQKKVKADKAVVGSKANDIFLDLQILCAEFESVIWNGEEQSLEIVTPDITLEDEDDIPHDLGSFKIKLYLKDVLGRINDGDIKAYRVYPNKNNSYSAYGEYCHPHLSSCLLCEGEGSHIITQTLKGCQLLDFFTIVTTILQTYNSVSPYYRLCEWESPACDICGSGTYQDTIGTCVICDNILCEDCQSQCESCGDSLCSEHWNRCIVCDSLFCEDHISCCESCEESACGSCVETCSKCGKNICANCILEVEGSNNTYCITCANEEEEELSVEKEKEREEASEALGQTEQMDEQIRPGFTDTPITQRGNSNDNI